MSPRDVLREAFAALSAHRLRATLSSIGIVVGVATVVTALAIGDGARRAAVDEISALGIDNVLVRALPPEPGDDPPRTRRLPEGPTLTRADADAIDATVHDLLATAALRVARAEVTVAARRIETTVIGATVAWRNIVATPLARGRWLAARDVGERRRVAVLGAALARALFGRTDPVGEYVVAAGDSYRVIGVLRSSSSAGARPSALQAFEVDTSLLVPLPAMDIKLGSGDTVEHVNEIAVRAARGGDVESVAEVVARVLQRRGHDAERYEIIVPRALLQARLRAQRTFNGVLLGVGGLALLISGIGIMNIMLASVAERTHEIGVRRAFGAREREVVAQFAVEASLLCIAGGAVGIPVGVALSAVVAWLAQWPVAISVLSVLIALTLAAGVGLLFGIYPAKVAARLDPVAALRAE